MTYACYEKRLARLRSDLASEDLDAIFIPGPSSDLQYILGIGRLARNPTDDNKYGECLYGAMISREHELVIAVPRMGAADHVAECIKGSPWEHCMTVIGDGVLSELDKLNCVAKNIIELSGRRGRVGVAKRTPAQTCWLLESVGSVEVVEASNVIEARRMVKSKAEVDALRKAALLTEKSFAAVLGLLSWGMSEQQIADEINRLFTSMGASGPSFHTGVRITGPGIVSRPVSGRKNGDTPIQPGSVISFDMGCVVDGYASDFGRTVFWGPPNDDLRKLHKIMMESQRKAILAMKAGQITAAKANAIARNVIEENCLGQYFTHRLGHSIGIDVHEPPFLFPGDETVLETGMCFTVEPSLSVPGVGSIRVEDVVMVTPEGGEPFHHFSHDLLVID